MNFSTFLEYYQAKKFFTVIKYLLVAAETRDSALRRITLAMFA